MKKDKLIFSKINELLVSNVETEKKFLYMLDRVDHTLLKNFLRVSGYQRSQFVKALDNHLRQKGSTPVYPDDTSDDLDLNLELRKALADNDYIFALSKIGKIQIDDIERYKRALNNLEFSENGEDLLMEQLDKLIKSLYSIEVYKDLISRNPVSA
ncbi:hypothetical protein MHTCC0001_00380 [Flavobacteriaceae bacterium MHTCC 0001]